LAFQPFARQGHASDESGCERPERPSRRAGQRDELAPFHRLAPFSRKDYYIAPWLLELDHPALFLDPNVSCGSWSCENALAEALTPRDFGEVAMFGHLAKFRGFSVWKAPDAVFNRLGWLCDRIRAHVCDDYALIAARTGWTPMMFMTRVRL
jgi:hypothetical protein